MHFGEHLMVDGYGGSKGKLNDRNLVADILNNLPLEMDMHKLSEPQIFEAKKNGSKDPGGWSGFVVIQESHISIHTFPNRGFLSADIYTCKNDLNCEYAISYLKKSFDLKDTETNFVKRGTRYPTNNIY